MKKHLLKFLLTLTLALSIGWVNGQKQITFVDFETASGYTTSVPEFTDGSYDYFLRTDGSDISGESFTNIQGSYYFAAQDIDGEGGPSTDTIFLNDINITGYSGLQLNLMLAEDQAGDGAEDWDVGDFLKIKYDIDNSGSFTDLIWFAGSNTNTEPSLDPDFDGTGNNSIFITDEFINFSEDIASTGGEIDIIIIISLNSGDEDIAIDNIKLTGFSTPVFQNSTPKSFNTLDTKTNLQVELDQAAVVYYDVVTPSGGAAPDAATLKTTATTNTTFFTVAEADVAINELIESLIANTTYDIFVAAENAANQITSVETVTLTTKTGAATVALTSEPSGNYDAPTTASLVFSASNCDFVNIKVWDPFSASWFIADPSHEMMSAAANAGANIDISIPADARTSAEYKVKVEVYGDETIFDESAAFSITDVTAPTVSTLSPTNGDVNVNINENVFTIEFSEHVQAGTGNIYIKHSEDNSIVKTIGSGDASLVDITDNVVTIDPDTTFIIVNEYYIEIDAGAFKDLSNNDFAGLTSTDWVFTTNNLVYVENFDDGTFGKMDTASLSGDTKEWYVDGTYAYMSGFNSGDLETDWLISPAINFDNSSTEKLTFETWYQYGTDDADNYLKLYYSIDYDGNDANIATATWNELTFTMPSSATTYTSSGNVDLSGIDGTAYIGFKYNYNSGSYRNWRVDNIEITGLGAGVPNFVTNKVDNIYDTQFDFQFQIDVPGTVYYFVDSIGETAPPKAIDPTAEEIKADGIAIEVTDPEELFNLTITKDSAGVDIASAHDYRLWYTVENEAGDKIGDPMSIDVSTKTAAPTLTADDLVGSPFTAPTTATITWTATDIDNLNLEIWHPIYQEWIMPDSSTQYYIDATLGTLDVIIPASAPSSTEWMIRLVPVSYESVTDTTATFEIIDNTAPTASEFTPATDATDISVLLDETDGMLIAKFDEDIAFGTGAITLHLVNDDVVETYNVETSDQLEINYNELYIYPSVPLDGLTEYHIEIAATAIEDLSGNAFAGFTDNAIWKFTTKDQNIYKVGIYDIQYTTGDASDYNTDTVMTSGIVTATSSAGYFMQDDAAEWHGIYVYSSDNVAQVGDSAVIIAKVDEYQNGTQLRDVISYEALKTGQTIPEPIAFTDLTDVLGEGYEGVLVTIENLECTDGPSSYDEFTFTDANDATIMADDILGYDHPFVVGNTYQLTGIRQTYFGDKITLRDANDANAYPTITGVTLDPTTPSTTDNVVVSATISDEETETASLTVGLFYGAAEGSETTEVTFDETATADVFEGTIPASTSTVYYKITANDGSLGAEYTGSYSVTTGINNPDGIVSMNVFPNPSNGLFTLEMNAAKAGNFQVEVVNIQGKVVYSKQITQDGFYRDEINITNEAKGIYYIRIIDGENSKVSRILIQ